MLSDDALGALHRAVVDQRCRRDRPGKRRLRNRSRRPITASIDVERMRDDDR